MESAQDYPFLPVSEQTVRPDRPAARTQQKLTQAPPPPPGRYGVCRNREYFMSAEQ